MQGFSLHSWSTLVFFFCFVMATDSSAQFFLVDSTTNEPVSYATISTPDKTWGTYSNVNGSFNVPISLAGKPLNISHIGYKSITITPQVNRIVLSQKAIQTDEIIVGSAKIKTKDFSIFSTKGKTINSLSMYGGEVATYFKINDESALIKSIEISMRKFTSKVEPRIRLRIYQSATTKLINPSLLSFDTVIQVSNSRRLIVNLEDSFVYTNNNFLIVSIEWLSDTVDQNGSETNIPQIFYAKPNNENIQSFYRMWNGEWISLDNVILKKSWVPKIKLRMSK